MERGTCRSYTPPLLPIPYPNTKRTQKKCCQWNYFIRKLRKFNMCRTINHLFYKSTVQSVLCYCLIGWGGSLSVKNRVLLDRVVRSASKTIGTTLPTVNETCVMEKTRDILKDTPHPLHKFYYVAQSGCRYISERTCTNRYCDTFLPNSVRRLNVKSDRGSDRGGWGDTMGRTTIIVIALSILMSLCSVVLCEYLPQEFPLWGTIKGYCAVLCCAVLCCAVLCCAVLCCAVLCCAVLCCAVLYCTVLYCMTGP